MKHPTALAVAVLASLTPAAWAQSMTWDLRGSAGEGSIGNVMVFEANGVELTASAWSNTHGPDNSALDVAALGQWSMGLGVRNANESSGSPQHQADNEGNLEFVLFLFDEYVDIDNVVIDPYGTYDRDVSYWTGAIDNPIDLTGVTTDELAGLGFSARIDDLSSSSSAARAVSIDHPAGGVNALLLGAWVGDDTPDDYFKIASVTGTVVPEPNAAALALAGLAGVCLFRRRT